MKRIYNVVYTVSLILFLFFIAPVIGKAIAMAPPQPETSIHAPSGFLPGIYMASDYRNFDREPFGLVGGLRTFNWSELESSPGVYNFNPIRNWLADEAAKGKRGAIAISSYNGGCCGGINASPPYMRSGDAVVVIWKDLNGDGQANEAWKIPRYWVDAYKTPYHNFVNALGNAFKNDSRLAWVATGVGRYGENAPCDLADVDNLESAGLTSALWISTTNEIIDMYVDAFAGGSVQLFNQMAPYFKSATERREIANHAADRGVGLSFNGLYPDDENAYNNNHTGKYDQLTSRGGDVPIAFETYRYMLGPYKNCQNFDEVYWGLLNGLDKHADVLRLNIDLFVQNVNPPYGEFYYDNYALFHWANRYLGKTVQNTPSVWVAMRAHRAPWQTCWQSAPDPGPWNYQPGNYKMWLTQDDSVSGGKTVAVTDSSAVTSLDGVYNPPPYDANLPDTRESWVARRTDQSSGNPNMFFKIDDDYLYNLSSPTPITISVIYLDRGSDTWQLLYDAQDGTEKAAALSYLDGVQQPVGTMVVQKTNSMTWRRAQFLIVDGRFANSLAGGSDFRIDCRNDGNEWIHFVDVTKTKSELPPAASSGTPTPTPTSGPTSTPTPTVTGTPPTATPTPTATFTPTPENTPTPTGSMPPDAVTVSFQKGMNGYQNSWDSYLDREAKSTNYGDADTLRVRTKTYDEAKTVIKFDVSSIPQDKSVWKATLSLYLSYFQTYDPVYTAVLRPYRLLKPWNEMEVTLNGTKSGVAWTVAGASMAGADYAGTPDDSVTLRNSDAPSWVTFDVTDMVNDWVQHPDENYGLLFVGTNDLDRSLKLQFISNDYAPTTKPQMHPKLEVIYYQPTPTPTVTPTWTGTPPTATPTATPTGTSTPTPTASHTPTPGPSPTPTDTTTITPTPVYPANTVWGEVCLDSNQNAICDPGEPPLGGSTIALYNGASLKISERLVLANGQFSFSALPPDTYRVVETDPPGYGSTTPNEAIVVIQDGLLIAPIHFGDYLLPTPTATPTFTPAPTATPTPTASPTPTMTPTATPTPGNAQIRLFVWDDLNENGMQDADEPGIPNAYLRLYVDTNQDGALQPSEPLFKAVYTASNGQFIIGSVPAAHYLILETDPPGYYSITNNVQPLNVDSSMTYDVAFGDRAYPFRMYVPLLRTRW